MNGVAQVLERGVRDNLAPSAKQAAKAVELAIRSVARGVVGVAERTEAVEALLAGKFAQVSIKGAHIAFSCADTIGSGATSSPASSLETGTFDAAGSDDTPQNDSSAGRVGQILSGSIDAAA